MDPAHRTKYIIAAVALVIITIAIYFLFIFQKGPDDISKRSEEGEQRQVQELTVGDRPFITLTPTADGAEIIISIENMGKFNAIEYELTYLADNPQSAGTKITRGATGTDVNTKDAKYKKSVLLGTASRGVRSPDTGITDGQLIMHMFVGEEEFLSETNWTFEKVGVDNVTIADKSGNFEITVPDFGKDYYVIVADTIGVPPNPEGFTKEEVILPIYGIFSIAPEFPKDQEVSIKLASETASAQLYSYNHSDGSWLQLDASSTADAISATVSNFATFVVVSSP